MRFSPVGLAILPVLFFAVGFPVQAQEISLSITSTVVQGDPLMLQVQGITNTNDITIVTFNGKPVAVFAYQGIPTAFVGIRLNQKPGSYVLRVVMKGGQMIKKTVTVVLRKSPERPLGIPAKLGGDTAINARNIVHTLEKDSKSLAMLKTAQSTLWTDAFALPLFNATVTDPYGYVRQTDGYSIAHLGTDFYAAMGTPVMAMNTGIVRKAQFYSTYGNTVVIDHGLGLSTLYMHLSKIKVSVGEMVDQAQVIGLSGSTGYATGPHLHVSVHIGGISVDPIAFLNLFK